jgi:hypothetical protein
VIVDSNDRPWIIASLSIAAAGGALYIPYAQSVSRPTGGSWPGLIYGIAGTAMMAFAGLLGARKQAPTLRIGRLQMWMRGHVWLGLLSFPMILFHGGFSMGGPLTAMLMIVFTLITLSGVFGLVLQQFMPKLMMEQIPTEVIYEQADEFLRTLIESSEQRVESLKPKPTAPEDKAGYEILREFYKKEILPFLVNHKHPGLLSTDRGRIISFDHIRKLVPPSSHAVVDDLDKFVRQRRDLAKQIKLHRILHGWLLVHVPLSAALLVLTLVHAIMALRYT